MFYTIGSIAIIIGSVLLALRTYVGIQQQIIKQSPAVAQP
jgi:hypothetical protein